MNKFYVTLASALAIGATVVASTVGMPDNGISDRQKARSERRAERKASATTVRKAPTGPKRVMGGKNGDKQLYGFCYESWFDGPLVDWMGAAEIHADGQHVKVSSDMPQIQSGCYYDGKFFGIVNNFQNSMLDYVIYDAETWECLNDGMHYTYPAAYEMPTDLTYDPVTDRIYGAFVNDPYDMNATESSKFGYINALVNPFEPVIYVGDLDVTMRGVAATADGTIYGIGLDNVLYTIDKNDASLTKLFDIDWKYEFESTDLYKPTFIGNESAVVDWETGVIYMSLQCVDESDTFIMKIDPTDGSVDLAANLGYFSEGTENCEVFSALFFKQGLTAAKGTPDSPTDVKVTVNGTSLDATVEFDMPSSDTDGNALSGTLDWEVTASGVSVAKGTAEAGSHVSTGITVKTSAMYDIQVTAALAGQASKPATARAFIGCDTPAIGVRPNAYADGCDVEVSWMEAWSVNNGNLDPVCYQVVRMPDEVIVAEATEETSIVDHIKNKYKAIYTYKVTPMSGDYTGEAVESRPVYAGIQFALPHNDSFTDETLFGQYPAIDANNDNNTWWIDTKRGAAVYSCNGNEANDFLLIGPFEMVAGSVYTIDFTADGHNVPEKFAAYVGTDPEDEFSFNKCVVPETFANPSIGAVGAHGEFTPEANGLYYFAIKACSGPSTKNLYIYDVSVKGVLADMPAAPEVTYVPQPSGARFEITLPSTDLSGSSAAGITSLTVTRDNEPIAELTEGVADGAKLTFTDNDKIADGFHTYGFAAVNDKGTGKTTTVRAYLGQDVPSSPRNMRAYEDLNQMGLIHVTWDAPAVGANGGYINPDEVNYKIDWLGYGQVGTGESNLGTNRSFDLQIPQSSITEQDIIAFTVAASNAKGTAGSLSKQTRSAYYGPSVELPLFESWANGAHESGIWSGESVLESEELFETWWDTGTAHPHIPSAQDADGYMLVLSTSKAGGAYRMRSPRVDVSKAAKPVLVLHLYTTAAAERFDIEAAVDDQPMKVVRSVDVNESLNKWLRIEMPLDEFKSSKRVQFGFTGYSNMDAEYFLAIDNVTIFDYVESDLAVVDFTAPDKIDVNRQGIIRSEIRNAGGKEVSGSDYTVSLIKNGTVVMTREGRDIKPYTNLELYFTDTPTVTDPETTVYSVVINYEADQNPGNNASAEVASKIVMTELPAVTDLAASDNNGVTLTWSAPDIDNRPAQSVTDGFDSYKAFDYSGYGDWLTYDGDGCPTVIMATVFGVLNYPNIGKPMAWQVFDPLQANVFHNAWYARSGEQMLVSFQACRDNAREVTSDDWLISPELNGSAQVISFFARAGMSNYAPEIVDIMYSTGGTTPADFKPVATDVEIPYFSDRWGEFTYRLPEGAKRFAIVHKSFDKFAVLLDDITYIPAGAVAEPLDLVGYNVYRDNKRITAEPVASTIYNDVNVEAGKTYGYHVTAVYDKGESRVSNRVEVSASTAIEGVTAETTMTVVTVGNTVTVGGVDGQTVSVYNVSGQLVAVATASPVAEFELPAAGVYIVRCGAQSAKTIVK